MDPKIAQTVTIVPSQDSQEAASKAGAYIETILKQCRDCPVLLLSSGGSSLTIFEHIDTSLSSERLTISVADERWGESDASNFRQLARTNWFQEAVKHMAHVIDSRVWDEHSLDLCAMHFGEILHIWKETHESGVIISTLGMRQDGQFASISPEPNDQKLFFDRFVTTPAWAVGYEAPLHLEYPRRITVTVPFLRVIDHALVYVCGEDKRDTLIHALSPDAELHVLPATIMRDMKNVHIFTDIKF